MSGTDAKQTNIPLEQRSTDTKAADQDAVEAIGIGLPREWAAFPLSRAAFDTHIRQQARDLRAAGASIAEVRRHELLTRQLSELLLAEDARYAATLTAVVASETPDDATTSSAPDEIGMDAEPEEVSLLAAAVAIFVRDRSSLGAPSPLTTDMLLHGLSSEDASDRVLDLDPPEAVVLPAGRAVRLARLHRSYVDGNPIPMESIAQTYLIPFDRGQKLCTLQFVTPNVEQGGAFSRLFEAGARTLRFFRPGEPTTFRAEDPAPEPSPSTEDR